MPTALSSGTGAKARICEFFGIITTTRKKSTTNRLKFSQLCFFLFFFKPLGLCTRCPLRTAPGGSEQKSGGEWPPIAFGDHGDHRRLWVGSSLAPWMRHCACAWGRTTFRSGLEGRRRRWHLSRWAAHTPPSAPPTQLYTQYIHTHTRPQGERACHLLRFESQGSIMGIKNHP